MDYAFLDEDGIVVGSHMAGLAAAALIDGDVYKDRAVLHLRQIFFLEKLGCCAAGNQDRADHEVRVLHGALDIAVCGDQGLDVGAEQVVQFLQALEIDVHDGHIGAHADRDPAGVHADCSAAQNDYVCLGGSGNTGKQNALTAEALLQILGSFLDGKTAGDLAHRRQAGERAVFFLHGLIGHCLHLSGKQGVRLGLVRRQVQIGVEDQTIVEETIFLLQRFLDLDHHLDILPDICCQIDHGGTRCHIFFIRKTGSEAGALLDQDLMARGDIGTHIIRCKADSEFIVFNLFDTSDLHNAAATSFS